MGKLSSAKPITRLKRTGVILLHVSLVLNNQTFKATLRLRCAGNQSRAFSSPGSPAEFLPVVRTANLDGKIVVSIVCVSKASPKAMVSWFKGGVALTNDTTHQISSDTTQLHVNHGNVSSFLHQNYVCMCLNPLGNQTREIQLKGRSFHQGYIFLLFRDSFSPRWPKVMLLNHKNQMLIQWFCCFVIWTVGPMNGIQTNDENSSVFPADSKSLRDLYSAIKLWLICTLWLRAFNFSQVASAELKEATASVRDLDELCPFPLNKALQSGFSLNRLLIHNPSLSRTVRLSSQCGSQSKQNYGHTDLAGSLLVGCYR